MALSPEVRKALGLADDATDEQITEALKTAGLAVLTPEPEKPAADVKSEPEKPAVEPEPEKVAASAAPVVTVDSAQFSAVQTELAQLRQWQAERTAADDKTRRDGILDSAVRAGKIHPTSTAQFRALLDSDETGTVALLSAMPAVVPVTPLGHAALSNGDADTEKAKDEAAYNSFIPGYKTKQKGA